MGSNEDTRLPQQSEQYRAERDACFEAWRKKRDLVDELQEQVAKANDAASQAACDLMAKFGTGPFLYEGEWFSVVKRKVSGKDLYMIRKANEMKRDRVEELVKADEES